MDKKHVAAEIAFEQTRDLFVAFGDRYRQEIILLLAEKRPMTVKDLSVALQLSRPAVSHHIKILKQAGMLDARRDGVRTYYFPTLKQPLQKLKQLIIEAEKIIEY